MADLLRRLALKRAERRQHFLRDAFGGGGVLSRDEAAVAHDLLLEGRLLLELRTEITEFAFEK